MQFPNCFSLNFMKTISLKHILNFFSFFNKKNICIILLKFKWNVFSLFKL